MAFSLRLGWLCRETTTQKPQSAAPARAWRRILVGLSTLGADAPPASLTRIDTLGRRLFLPLRIDVRMRDPQAAVRRGDGDPPSPVGAGRRGVGAAEVDRAAVGMSPDAVHGQSAHVPGIDPVPGSLAGLRVVSDQQ